jgi:hypothetical protein
MPVSLSAQGACYTPATVQFLNAPEWDGVPFVVGQLFVLTKGNRTARCVVQAEVPLARIVRLLMRCPT